MKEPSPMTNPPTKPIISAGITRVSLERQVENYSLAAQRARFQTLAEKYHCIIPDEFILEDDGYSGADFNRPSLARVLHWIRSGKVQAVAFTHVDRFSRNIEGGLALIRRFREAGAQVLLG